MTQWRLLLALIALTYAGLGFAFLFNPTEMAAIASTTLATPAAHTDFRAVYGGTQFGVGVFLLFCTFRKEFVRVGLFAAACALVATAASRTIGLVLDGFSMLQAIVALTEWIGGGLATWGALEARTSKDELPPPIEDPTPGDPLVPPAA